MLAQTITNRNSSTLTASETIATEGTTAFVSSVGKENIALEHGGLLLQLRLGQCKDDTLAGWTSELDDTYNPDILSFSDVAFDPCKTPKTPTNNSEMHRMMKVLLPIEDMLLSPWKTVNSHSAIK